MKTKEKTRDFETFINQSEKPVLVDFWAEWCGPCKMMNPIIKKIASRFSGRLKVIKVDTEKKPHIAQRYQIRGIPTLILFKNGEPVWRKSGAMQESQLAGELEKNL